MQDEFKQYIISLYKDIPQEVYEGLLSVSCLGVVLFIAFKGVRTGFRWSSVLLLIEYTKCTQTMVKYAFDVLGMHKVTAEVLSENAPSLAMFKKCGFAIDGCLRDEVFKNDRYYDVMSLSILANEL